MANFLINTCNPAIPATPSGGRALPSRRSDVPVSTAHTASSRIELNP